MSMDEDYNISDVEDSVSTPRSQDESARSALTTTRSDKRYIDAKKLLQKRVNQSYGGGVIPLSQRSIYSETPHQSQGQRTMRASSHYAISNRQQLSVSVDSHPYQDVQLQAAGYQTARDQDQRLRSNNTYTSHEHQSIYFISPNSNTVRIQEYKPRGQGPWQEYQHKNFDYSHKELSSASQIEFTSRLPHVTFTGHMQIGEEPKAAQRQRVPTASTQRNQPEAGVAPPVNVPDHTYHFQEQENKKPKTSVNSRRKSDAPLKQQGRSGRLEPIHTGSDSNEEQRANKTKNLQADDVIPKKTAACELQNVATADTLLNDALALHKAHDEKIKQVEKHNTSTISVTQSQHLHEKLQSMKMAKEAKITELKLQQNEFVKVLDMYSDKLDDNDIRKMFERECERFKAALPIYAAKSKIVDTTANNQVFILLGELGCGKSTQLIQYVYEATILGTSKLSRRGQIVCTQSTKAAAITLAHHVAQQIRCQVGDTVGYRVDKRGEENTNTAIKYVTDHVLLEECLADATMSKYSCIVVDEAHQRTLCTDFLLGLLKQAVSQRPDLHLIILSDASHGVRVQVFQKYFNNCPVVEIRKPAEIRRISYQNKHIDEQPNSRYVTLAVEQAWQRVKSAKNSEDILVFLASAADVDSACKQLMKFLDSKKIVHCLPLHEGVQISEISKVFEPAPSGMCKVVFATNLAESSLIIPNITCVIDSGLVKDKRFDASRNMTRLMQRMISRSSTEQRSSRLGNSEQEACYRLYTKEQYAAMTAALQPEILCMPLTLAILKFLELGLSNPHKFEFIERPPNETLDGALAMLTKLGAVANYRLTEAGRQLAKLGMEPRCGTFVLRAHQTGNGYDAACIVAMSTLAGSVFFCNSKSTEEEKLLVEKSQVHMCHKTGDHLTNLSVFQAWLANSTDIKKSNWCEVNGVKCESMQSASKALDEILEILHTELKLEVELKFRREDVRDSIMPCLISECFASNLARFTGHKERGYYVLNRNQCLLLHPSSSLILQGQTLPKWIVFEQSISTDKEYILNVTEVPESDVVKMNQQGIIICNIGELALREIRPLDVASNLGKSVVSSLIGQGGVGKQILEENIEQTISKSSGIASSHCVLKYRQGRLKAFCTEYAQRIVEDAISGRLQVIREDISNLTLEKPLVVGKQVRVELQAGLELKQLMTEEDFITFAILKIPDHMTKIYLEGQLAQFGQYSLLDSQSADKSWATIKFENSFDAKQAADWCENNQVTIKVPTINCQEKPEFRIIISWLRRPNKGTALISFESPTSATEFLQSLTATSLEPKLMVRGQRADVALHGSDNTQLQLSNLPDAATRDDVEEACDKAMPSAYVTGVTISYKYELPLPEGGITGICQTICNAVGDILTRMSLHCDVSEPVVKSLDKTTVRGRATVGFSDLDCAMRVAEALNDRLLIQSERAEVYLEPSTIFVKETIYRVIRERLICIAFGYADTGIKVRKFRTKDNNILITISGRHPHETVECQLRIAKVVSPQIFQIKNLSFLQILSSQSGERFLKSLGECNVYAELDKLLWTVKLFGSDDSKREAMSRLEKYEADSSDVETKEINLNGEKMPKGLMKDILNHYNCDVELLKAEIGALYCALNIRKQTLTVVGSAESLQKLDQVVQSRANQLTPLMSAQLLANNEIAPSCCPICMSDIPADKIHYLELCGHAYCLECLRLALQNAVSNRELPITCCYDDCGQPLAIDDICQLVSDSEAEWQEIVAASVESYVRLSGGEIQNCFTPNCLMVYEETTDGSRLICPLCKADICTTCKVAYHQGFTCDVYQKLRYNPDSLLTQWLDEDRANRKVCPRCQAPIEKTGGCNHMTCSNCRKHMCWICMAMFETGKETYAHIYQSHPGQLFV